MGPTVIIGAGQAGLALSHHLSASGHPHVLLERGRVAERWRSERWQSLHLLTPNWLNRLPGSAPHADPQGFLRGSEFGDYLDAYAASFDAPVRTGVAVGGVRPTSGGYVVRAGRTEWLAGDVVLASGDLGAPAVPAIAGTAPRGVAQLHSSQYQAPHALPPGGVLVVGAGASGQQIAAELRRSGRHVVLSAGRHLRMLRRYRGRDAFEWLSALGDLGDPVDETRAAGTRRGFPLTGLNGGEQLDLGVLRELGVVLAGRLARFDGSTAIFGNDLEASVAEADARMRHLLGRIDAHCAATGEAHPPAVQVAPVSIAGTLVSVDLAKAGIGSIVWATGFQRHFPWLHVPGVLDAAGDLVHRHGVTPAPGLYALGLRFQRSRSSHIIGGVGADAAYLAERILAAGRAGRGRVRVRGRRAIARAA